MFDELWKEATEIPYMSRMRFLTEIQRPFGFPKEPVLTTDAACGLNKIAHILKNAQDEEEATRQLEQQALVDPQIQQALDFEQLKNERDSAVQQVQQMNQQLFDSQSAQAMSDQQAQQMGQQVADLEGQIEQEQVGRQQAQQEMIASKDQSLQEQMTVQNQKQQMNDAAQMFQEQANMLTQQLKGIAAQPTAPPPPDPMGMGGPPGAPGMEGMPPPASADAAQEQQEAANAQQEAAIQGDQAATATEEDMAKQEQAAMGGAPPPEGMPPEAMPKQGSVAKLAAEIKEGYFIPSPFVMPIQHMPTHLDPDIAKSEGRTRGGIIGGAIGAGAGGMAGLKHGIPGALAGAALGGTAGAVGLGGLTGKLEERKALKNRERYKGNLMARKQLRDEAKQDMAKDASLSRLNPQAQGAIIGAAVGALGGIAGGGAGGGTVGRQDTPFSPISGEAKGGLRGAIGGAVSGAAGGALVGHTLTGKNPQKNLKKLLGGSALILGSPIVGGAAAVPASKLASANDAMDRILEKTSGYPTNIGLGAVTGGTIGGLAGGTAGTLGGLMSAPEGQRLEGALAGARKGAWAGATTGALGGGIAGARYIPGTSGKYTPPAAIGLPAGLAPVTAAPVAGLIYGSRAGKGVRPEVDPMEGLELVPEDPGSEEMVLREKAKTAGPKLNLAGGEKKKGLVRKFVEAIGKDKRKLDANVKSTRKDYSDRYDAVIDDAHKSGKRNTRGHQKPDSKPYSDEIRKHKEDAADEAYRTGKKRLAYGGATLGTVSLATAGAKALKKKKSEDKVKEAAQLSKCSGCGKMTKHSELGKCSGCGCKKREEAKD